MDKQTELQYLIGIFGRIDYELVKLGFIDKKTQKPIRRNKMDLIESDGIAIHAFLHEKAKKLRGYQVKQMVDIMNEKVSMLIENDMVLNHYLFCVLMLKLWVDNHSDTPTQIKLTAKIRRAVDKFIDLDGDDVEANAKIRRDTGRVADNMYRQYVGKPQLSNAVRDAQAKRFIKGR